jgi:glucose-1-phosphate thymidylyltransferase
MSNTKGVILAGGTGTRLFPLTKSTNKHLLPVYDKPLFYYPLSNILLSKINDVAIVIDKKDYKNFLFYKEYFKNFNIKLDIIIQNKPVGILDAVKVIFDRYKQTEKFLFLLGDNFFYGESLPKIISNALSSNKNTVFSYYVKNPHEYGIFEKNKIIEKPKKTNSNMAVTGMYIYLKDVGKFSSVPKKSKRGEYEITDFNNILIKNKLLHNIELGRGVVWLDTGSPVNLIRASQFVNIIEERQGLKISCPEEIALNLNLVSKQTFKKNINILPKSFYREYLEKTLKRV